MQDNSQIHSTALTMCPVKHKFSFHSKISKCFIVCNFLLLVAIHVKNFRNDVQISNHLELIKPNPKDDPDKQRRDAEFASTVFGSDIDLVGGSTQNESFMALSDVRHCGKMRALEKLFTSWTSQGDKILLFSYSVRLYACKNILICR